jgi:hypothetical protein
MFASMWSASTFNFSINARFSPTRRSDWRRQSGGYNSLT